MTEKNNNERIIGAIQSDIKWLRDGQTSMLTKIDHMLETLNKGDGKIAGIRKDLDDHSSLFNKIYNKEITVNSDFRKTSKTQIGLLGGVAGALVTFIIWVLEKLKIF